MKNFEMPEIQVEEFAIENVITASGNGTILPDDEV